MNTVSPLRTAYSQFRVTVSEFLAFKDLLWLWTMREVRVRYKQSVLGTAWAILQPLALAAMFTLVFSLIVKVPTGTLPYPLYSYTAVLVWTLLSGGITSGINSLINNMNLVGKIYFPREILPMATIAAALVDFVVAGSGVVVLLAWYRWPIHVTALWMIPLIALLLMIMTGLTLMGSAAIVYYRDFRFLVPLALQLWFYGSPIIYPVDLVPEDFRSLYALNPLVGILSGIRDALLLGKMPDLRLLLPALALGPVVLMSGYVVFKRAERGFADVI